MRHYAWSWRLWYVGFHSAPIPSRANSSRIPRGKETASCLGRFFLSTSDNCQKQTLGGIQGEAEGSWLPEVWPCSGHFPNNTILSSFSCAVLLPGVFPPLDQSCSQVWSLPSGRGLCDPTELAMGGWSRRGSLTTPRAHSMCCSMCYRCIHQTAASKVNNTEERNKVLTLCLQLAQDGVFPSAHGPAKKVGSHQHPCGSRTRFGRSHTAASPTVRNRVLPEHTFFSPNDCYYIKDCSCSKRSLYQPTEELGSTSAF